ncbi:MAG: Group 1 glycosyl transferase protein [Bacteroidetes bacterium]|nr:Group 1 glycosyl transferase protein [Bacteroidota bacterium]
MMEPDFPPRRVLVIAYYFPPMGLSGVQRTLKFVKYLPKYSWRPTVLTVEPRGYYAKDESLMRDLDNPDITVVRTAPAGPGKLSKKDIVDLPPERMRKTLSRFSDVFFIPDNKVGWISDAVKRALQLHKENPFDLIFSTAPPFTDFLIGAAVKAKINKPLVLDYRDPWVDYPFKFYPTPLHKQRNIALERRALRASSHIVTTNRRVKEVLISRYGFLSYVDIDIIPQGFDPEDFAWVKEKSAARAHSDKMKITYAGVFWEDRIPDYFLQALHDLFHEKPKLRGRIEAVFAGNFREENLKLVSRLGLQDTVKVLGYLSHPDCIREIVDSDVLWVIVGDDLGSPGKTYEYIGAGKPILGCVPQGFLKHTIEEAGGQTVAPDDVVGIKKAIAAYFDQFERHALKGPKPDIIEKYNRVSLTGSLVKIFESLIVT